MNLSPSYLQSRLRHLANLPTRTVYRHNPFNQSNHAIKNANTFQLCLLQP
jgi:hypothetical protein